MADLDRLVELCKAMGPDGGPTTLIAGYSELPEIFGLLGSILHDQETRLRRVENLASSSRRSPLTDLVEHVLRDKLLGKYGVDLNPKDYGFDNEEDMWRRIRELAGIPEGDSKPKG